MKIVVNKCFGGFGLSPTAIEKYLKLKGKECFFYQKDYETNELKKVTLDKVGRFGDTSLTKDFGPSIKDNWDLYKDNYFYYGNIERTDPDLVKVIEELGADVASASLAKLCIVEVPDDIEWEIDDYDGFESVHELHRSW